MCGTGIEDNEFADVVTQALAKMFPNDPPRFLARTPHGYRDKTDPQRPEAAGFTDIAIDAVEHSSAAPSPREPAIAYCQGTPLRSEIEARGAPGLEAGPTPQRKPSPSALAAAPSTEKSARW